MFLTDLQSEMTISKFLERFECAADSEYQSFISGDSFMCREGCDDGFLHPILSGGNLHEGRFLSSVRMSSIFGITFLSLATAVFAWRVSMHKRIFLDDFVTATIGLSQVVSP